MTSTSPPMGLASESDLHGLLEQVPVGKKHKRELRAMMSGADRFYHDLNHLETLWQRHCRFGAQTDMHDPAVHRLIAAAIAFHDAVYDSGRRDNEVRSAEFWMTSSEGSAFSLEERDWVAESIVATQDHLGYKPKHGSLWDLLPLEERARIWFLDLDLTPIGETEAEFDANTRRLRAEHSARSDDEVERGRLRFLARLSARPTIYRSPVLAEAFEASARQNLARELAKTGASLP